MKKPLFIVAFLVIVIVAELIVRISLINSISTGGIKIVDLQNQTEYYRQQNEILKVKYLQAASFTTISQEAKKLGYVPESSEIDLSAPLPLALR